MNLEIDVSPRILHAQTLHTLANLTLGNPGLILHNAHIIIDFTHLLMRSILKLGRFLLERVRVSAVFDTADMVPTNHTD